jgi:hypothetical protein
MSSMITTILRTTPRGNSQIANRATIAKITIAATTALA